jgi:hypothetical protein
MKKILYIAFVVLFALISGSCSKDCPSCPSCPASEKATFVVYFQDVFLPSTDYVNACSDAGMSSNTPATAYGGGVTFATGSMSGAVSRLLIRFYPQMYIPASAKISKAILTIKNTSSSYNVTYNIHKVTQNWNEATVTWNNSGYGAWTGGAYDAAVIGTASITAGERLFSIEISPAVVQEWIKNSNLNRGVILKSADETAAAANCPFMMRETGTTEGPMLAVYYTLD